MPGTLALSSPTASHRSPAGRDENDALVPASPPSSRHKFGLKARREVTGDDGHSASRRAHRDNWRAPGCGSRAERVAIRFSAEDVGIADAVARARTVDARGLRLRLAGPLDLLTLKLAAAEEPTRRPSKRTQDLLDILTLAETYPTVAAGLTTLEQRVERLGATLLTLGWDGGLSDSAFCAETGAL